MSLCDGFLLHSSLHMRYSRVYAVPSEDFKTKEAIVLKSLQIGDHH